MIILKITPRCFYSDYGQEVVERCSRDLMLFFGQLHSFKDCLLRWLRTGEMREARKRGICNFNSKRLWMVYASYTTAQTSFRWDMSFQADYKFSRKFTSWEEFFRAAPCHVNPICPKAQGFSSMRRGFFRLQMYYWIERAKFFIEIYTSIFPSSIFICDKK